MKSHIDILTNLLFPPQSELEFYVTKRNILPQMNSIIKKMEIYLRNFRESLKNLTEDSLSDLEYDLIQILGVGEGSTPISDDFLIGILSAIYITAPNILEKYTLISKFPFQRYTTFKSAQLIRKVLLQEMPNELFRFLNVLKTPLASKKSINQFEREINRVKSIGVSSGYYFLFGILWELKFSLNSMNK
ncbi:MAG: DUF2877 domain-containing protein [Candidatus Hodarchaeota archaeon]